MILTYDDPDLDICRHSPEARLTGPGTVCYPTGLNGNNPSDLSIDWSGVVSTPQKKHHLAEGEDPKRFANWNATYPQGVVVGKLRRHVLMDRRHVEHTPEEDLTTLVFVASEGIVAETVEGIHWWNVGKTAVARLLRPLPSFIATYPVCDMRAASPGRVVWLRSNQDQSIAMQLTAIGMDGKVAVSFGVRPAPGMPEILSVRWGDSGTPVLTATEDKRTAFCGTLWGQGCLPIGTQEWDDLEGLFAEIGDEIEVVRPDFDVGEPEGEAWIQVGGEDVPGDDFADRLGKWMKELDPPGV